MALPKSDLTPDNCAFLMIDHQVGLMQFLPSIDPMILKHNILGMAKTAKAFNIPVLMGTSWPQGPNGPTMPELRALFPMIRRSPDQAQAPDGARRPPPTGFLGWTRAGGDHGGQSDGAIV